MKQTSVTVKYDAEKLRAIQKYLVKKEIALQNELAEQLDRLYEKHVPNQVREYLEDIVAVDKKSENKAKSMVKVDEEQAEMIGESKENGQENPSQHT
ncbi:MAG: DUF6103 family protein [Bacillota bacterium]